MVPARRAATAAPPTRRVASLAGGFVIKYVRPFIKRIGQFLDDWNGEPARPGRDESPGVMARLKNVEETLEEHSAILSAAGQFVGREQVARIKGHEAQTELFRTIQEIQKDAG